jgi:hypothetical protein
MVMSAKPKAQTASVSIGGRGLDCGGVADRLALATIAGSALLWAVAAHSGS